MLNFLSEEVPAVAGKINAFEVFVLHFEVRLRRNGLPLRLADKVGSWRASPSGLTRPSASYLGLLRDRQCVFDLNPDVADGALELGVAEQELDGA